MTAEAHRPGRVPVYAAPALSVIAYAGLVLFEIVAVDNQNNGWYFAIPGALTSATALVIVSKRPENRFGTLLAVLGLTISVSALLQATIPLATSLAVRVWRVIASDAMLPLFFVLIFVAIPLLYPTGQTLNPRWRLLLYLGLMWALIVLCGSLFMEEVCVRLVPGTDVCPAFAANPSGLGFIARQTAEPVAVAGVLLAPPAVAGLLTRYARSSGVQRLQIRWLLFSIALAASVFVFSLTSVQEALGLSIPETLLNAALGIAFVTIPVACGVAILRNRLYDIDRIVSRTVTYALVVGLLAGGVIRETMQPTVAAVWVKE